MKQDQYAVRFISKHKQWHETFLDNSSLLPVFQRGKKPQKYQANHCITIKNTEKEKGKENPV